MELLEKFDNLYVDFNNPIAEAGKAKGIQIKVSYNFIDFKKENKIIRIAIKHFVYCQDIINSFSYYFLAVTPKKEYGYDVVDYSSPLWHEVIGFDLHPIIFPSFAEPVITTQQYLEFANLKPGHNVIDLGAYSGLTSIIFSESIGNTGTVVAIDADPQNIACINSNISLYKKIRDHNIKILHGAAWEHNEGLVFSSEGNMGSAAVEYVGITRGSVINTASYTLSRITEETSMDHIDFIKCDIEGAEKMVFNDSHFFQKHSPRIMCETHICNGVETTDVVIQKLSSYGYLCQKILQHGVTLPLLQCYRA